MDWAQRSSHCNTLFGRFLQRLSLRRDVHYQSQFGGCCQRLFLWTDQKSTRLSGCKSYRSFACWERRFFPANFTCSHSRWSVFAVEIFRCCFGRTHHHHHHHSYYVFMFSLVDAPFLSLTCSSLYLWCVGISMSAPAGAGVSTIELSLGVHRLREPGGASSRGSGPTEVSPPVPAAPVEEHVVSKPPLFPTEVSKCSCASGKAFRPRGRCCYGGTHCRRSQWALPDLNRNFQIAVGTAGPQRKNVRKDVR